MTSPLIPALHAFLSVLEDNELPCHDATIFSGGSFNLTVNTDEDLQLWALALEQEPVMAPATDGGLTMRVAGTVGVRYFWVGSRQVHPTETVTKEVPV